MSELLMDLADCGSPERLIQTILRHHPDWEPPVPLEALATAVNIIDIRELDTASFEGALMTDSDKTQGIILYRPGVPAGRRRFTIGHELGHFLIPTHTGNRQCTPKDMSERRFVTPEQRREAEANRFAAGLLMPKPWFERDADRLGAPEVGHLKQLARRYDVSLEAAANRYVELIATPCAVIFSYEGRVRYARSEGSFPALAVTAKDMLPADCATIVSPPSILGVASSWTEVDGTTWLRHEWGERPPSLLEQVLLQANGYALTMLVLADPIDDVEDDEEDVVERWRPKF